MSVCAFYEPKLVTEFVGEFLHKDISRPLSDQDHIKVRIRKGFLSFFLFYKKKYHFINLKKLYFNDNLLFPFQVKTTLRGVRVEVRRHDYMRHYKVHSLTVQPIRRQDYMRHYKVHWLTVQPTKQLT